ncbi:endonuclease-3 [Bryocella elongata]|uniref:Endonuclease-3 n=1 Tax=Bryocella elongata TaxID=863522 RepID=A0A1H5Y4E0_9BACT|nr:iron-sulfur cluster loop [Bryocella elongata]SEG18665.1 endonuclease-3 [Bryocella elongata]
MAAADNGTGNGLFPSSEMEEAGRRPLTPEQADKLPHIHRLLLGYYGQPKRREPRDPLTQLIYSMMASRTKTEASEAALRDLQRAFQAGPGNWEPVRDAAVRDIERAIALVTFPEQKAERIKLLLNQISARVGELTLEFLHKYRTDKIRSWLEQFEGVGPQVSAAVVNFSTLRRRALVIDANHLRVIQRLCVVPRGNAELTEERLMRLVPETWDAEMLDEDHMLVKLHAQTLCVFSDPKCEGCPLLKICPSGQRNMAELQLTAPQ